MSRVEISGHSDDCLEVDGDISEEFYAKADDDTDDFLAFSDGTVLRIEYTKDGCWRITPKVRGTASYSKVEGEGADSKNYSDVVTLEGDLRWVVHGIAFVASASPSPSLATAPDDSLAALQRLSEGATQLCAAAEAVIGIHGYHQRPDGLLYGTLFDRVKAARALLAVAPRPTAPSSDREKESDGRSGGAGRASTPEAPWTCPGCPECEGKEHHWVVDCDENERQLLTCLHCAMSTR